MKTLPRTGVGEPVPWELVRRGWGGGGAEDGREPLPSSRGLDYGFLFRSLCLWVVI